MELSIVIDDGKSKVKFKDGGKTLELSREYLEMGFRFLNAAEGKPYNYQEPAPTQVGSNEVDVSGPPVGSQQVLIEPAPTFQRTSPAAQEAPPTAPVVKKAPPKKQANVEKVKLFTKEMERQNQQLKEDGNAKAVGTELPIRKAILKMKSRVDYESMQKAVRVAYGIPGERFEIIFSQAGKLNDSD